MPKRPGVNERRNFEVVDQPYVPDLTAKEINARFQAALTRIKAMRQFTIDPDERRNFPAGTPYRCLARSLHR